MPTAINISALEAKDIARLHPDYALISINVPGEAHHDLAVNRNDSRVLTVAFWDIAAKREYMGNTISPIDGDTALAIVRFVETWKHKDFIVHCQAGISRSAAVCLYINQVYGHKLKENFWRVSHPNPYVLGKLFILRSMSEAHKTLDVSTSIL